MGKFFRRTSQIFLFRNYNINKKNDYEAIIITLYFSNIQLSLQADNFFESSQKYMNSYIRDRKRFCPDFEHLNQLYLIVIGDEVPQNTQNNKQNNKPLVLIDINLTIDDKYISETFLWNSDNTSNIAIQHFVSSFLNDIITEHNINVDKDSLKQLQEEAKIQLKTQVCYKTLLKKYAPLLLNFSTMELSQDIRQYTIHIQLKIVDSDNQIVLEDNFEWDILNQLNNVQKFCERLIEDLQIPRKYFSEMCYKIRTQINAQLEWKFTMLVKTYKSILRDRQSPKFHTQTTTSQIKKNLVYTMDVALPYNPDQNKPIDNNIYLNNSDLFSLLSRHIDILPEEFQQTLLFKQSKNGQKEYQKLDKIKADEHLKKIGVGIQGNKYLGNVASNYQLHTLWRKSLHK